MKKYTSPQLIEYGDVAGITAIFGSEMTEDVLVNPAGNVVQTGTGSIDACPTQTPAPGGMCTINP
jgi:hypothetical protein